MTTWLLAGCGETPSAASGQAQTVTVSISPTTASLAAGGALKFTATVDGTANGSVT